MENIPIGLSTAFGLFTLHGMKGYQRRERAACIDSPELCGHDE